MLDPRELETGEAAVEVVILWGELSILHVAHLSPPRTFAVGEAEGADFLIGSESLGTAYLPVVVEHNSRTALVIPDGAEGFVSIADLSVSFEALAAEQQLVAAPQWPSASLYVLPFGASARVHYRGFTFVVNQTFAARRVGVGGGERRSWNEHVWTFASMLVHASLLVSFHFLPPRSSVLTVDLLNADSRLVSYFDQPLKAVDEKTPKWLDPSADSEGGTGKSHAQDDGKMGKPDKSRADKKYAIKGPVDNPDPHMARDAVKDSAGTAGIIGVIKQNVGAWGQPTSIFGRESASGRDAQNAVGSLFGSQNGEDFGFGGLGVRGHGRGGGGDGHGTVGLGKLGTLGHGGGTGDGDDYGRGAARLGPREAKVPRIRVLPADVDGALSKEVIRRTINRHINEVRHCYVQALTSRPDLQGRVAIRFIINPTGAVQTAVAERSDLGDASVERCVAQAVRRWSFPAPDGGGLVIVSYPFVFSQAGN